MNPAVRVYPQQGYGNVRAYCSATLYGSIGIRGMKVVEGKNGLFVSMPQMKNRKGEYSDIAFPVTKEAYMELTQAVLDTYEQVMNQNNDLTAEQTEQAVEQTDDPFAAPTDEQGQSGPTMQM